MDGMIARTISYHCKMFFCTVWHGLVQKNKNTNVLHISLSRQCFRSSKLCNVLGDRDIRWEKKYRKMREKSVTEIERDQSGTLATSPDVQSRMPLALACAISQRKIWTILTQSGKQERYYWIKPETRSVVNDWIVRIVNRLRDFVKQKLFNCVGLCLSILILCKVNELIKIV